MTTRGWLCTALAAFYLLALGRVVSTDLPAPAHRESLTERCARLNGEMSTDGASCLLPDGRRLS